MTPTDCKRAFQPCRLFSLVGGRPVLRRATAGFLIAILGLPLRADDANRASQKTEPPSNTQSKPDPDAEAWTLERAIARALEANPDLLEAKYNFERQEGTRLQIVAQMLPQVTGSATMDQRQRTLVDYDPRSPFPPSALTAVAVFDYDLRIEVRQTVFDGLTAWNQTKRQQLLSKQSFLALKNAVMQTVSLVRQAFDAIQLRTAVTEAEQRRLDEYVQLVDLTARKEAAGEIPEFELLRAQSEMESARADLAEARRALGQAQQTFRRLLQIPDSAGTVKVIGKFEPRPFDLPLADAIERARANRPDLEAAELALRAARRNEKAELGTLVPKIDAFAYYDARSSYYNSGVQRNGWTFGVLGQWNIFDGGAARGRRMSLRAERHSAENKLTETEHEIVSKLRELYESLRQAQVAMEAQQKSKTTSQRAWRDARRLYEAGQASLEQVLETSAAYRRADAQYSGTIYNYNAIVAEIEFSVGGKVSDSLEIPDTWKP
jgi:outer membrane protein TolC